VLPVELLDEPFGCVVEVVDVFGFGLLIELAPPTDFVVVFGAVVFVVLPTASDPETAADVFPVSEPDAS
jgi:hypothetical protein